jgi:glycosyltransferase involved in cell wall biosynthesis
VLDAVLGYRESTETRPLVVVGSAPYSQWYVERVREAADADPRVRPTGGIYDQHLLDQLYANCVAYVHGHSVGGTNPSLLRAMGAGAPVLAYDVEFNREVTAGEGFFWADAPALTEILDAISAGTQDSRLDVLRAAGQQRVREAYQWDAVTDDYEALIHRLAARRRRS